MEKGDSLSVVIAQVMRLHFTRSHKLLLKIGVYPGQPSLLSSLQEKDGQSQKELSDIIKVKPATVAVMIKRMEKSGFILKKQDNFDQRVTRIFLTEEGKRICKELNKFHKEIDEECFGDFTGEEKLLFKKLVLKVRNNLINISYEKKKKE